jgi:SAM-dependent methyltransferase
LKEFYYDKLLGIKTKAYKKGGPEILHYYPYEPTEYRVLETLLAAYPLSLHDCIVDFGSGKGRLCFFLHYYSKVQAVTGVEMDEKLHQDALNNKIKYVRPAEHIQFHLSLAEKYEIRPADNRFYFFNPFSVHIFTKVVNHILLSVEEHAREIELILYYPTEDYIFYLENHSPFSLKEEIPVTGMVEQDSDERFLIYQL